MSDFAFDEKTQITEDVLKEIRGYADDLIAEFKKDGGGVVGDKQLAPDPRLNAYWQSVTLPDGMIDMHDVALIMPDEQGRFVYEVQIRNGLSTDMPHSPTWVNYLRIPDMFTEKAKDFVRLVKADEERKSKEPNALPEATAQGNAPFAPSPGPPVPVAAALGSPQPNGGGGYVGNGAFG